MTTKHTPGPWIADKSLSPQGKAIMRHYNASVGMFTPVDDFCINNAKLMASAPDLLEALQAIIEDWKINNPAQYASDMATNAIKAIRKAQGGEV